MISSKIAIASKKLHKISEFALITKWGYDKLAKPFAIRSTSESIIYPHFQQWIHSYRDLPIKLSQNINVVQAQYKDSIPFLRAK